MNKQTNSLKAFIYPYLSNSKLKTIWILLFVWTFPLLTMAQWETQSAVPTHLQIRGTASLSPQHVFIVTTDDSFDNKGSLYESMDGGASWIARDIPNSLASPLNGIYFLDNVHGWVFGNEQYRTLDGGVTWDELPLLGTVYSMKFFTPSFGLINDNSGDHKVSHDGGFNWQLSPFNISVIDFIDNQIGLGVSDTGIYRTTNAGLTFEWMSEGDAIDVKYLNSTNALAIMNDSIYNSTDGGLTWNQGVYAEGKSHLVRVSDDIVLLWGTSGTFPNFNHDVYRSSDGGQTWANLGVIMDPGQFNGSYSFAIPDPTRIVANDGAGGMHVSMDAGASWTQTFMARGGVISGFIGSHRPVFSDAMNGYAGFGDGFVLKTIDGGLSWMQVSSGLGQTINDIDRFSNGDLIAVGEAGTILLNSGGNDLWIVQPWLTSTEINAVQVIGQDEVVMVDDNSQVYFSLDKGLSWSLADSIPPNLNASDIHFTSLTDGWVIGNGFSATGILFHTSDGGSNWVPTTGFLGNYKSIDVEGSSIWASNVSGLYQRSIDGGATFVSGNLPGSPHQIQDMDFYNENIGYAVGWYGEAFRSDDGGETWNSLPTPNNQDKFTDIYISAADVIWLATTENQVFYSANGGQGWSILDVQSDGFGNFSSVVANSSGHAWTAGFQGYIEHFSGTVPPPFNQPPNASFDFLTTGLQVEFTDTSSDPDGTIVAWAWDFDDGNTSTVQHPTHTFLNADTYVVGLTVFDDDGDSTYTIRIISVQPLPGGVFGDFTEVTPLDSLFITPQDEDFWVISSASSDFDSDGDLDIAVLGYYVVYNQSVDYRLVLLRNDGQISTTEWEFDYIDVDIGDMTTGSSDLAWGDVDGDGDQDLAVGSNGETVIFRNDSGNLIITDTQLPGYNEDNFQADFDLHSISWADYDNDGDQDLLIPSAYVDSTFSFKTALMRNDGANGTGGWNFVETDSTFAPTKHAQSQWADYDGDLDLDLLLVNIVPNTTQGFIRRYRNDGNGVFVGEDILDSIIIHHGEAHWGDYDADGDLDLLVVGDIGNVFDQALRIYVNDNDIYNTVLEVNSCSTCAGWFDYNAGTWADYDADGDVDILLAGNYSSGSQIEGRARIYKNDFGVFTADTSSTLPAPEASGNRGGTFSWLDLDNDGDLDYFIAGQYFVPGGNGLVESQMHAYRNDVVGQNAKPSTPTGLSFTAIGANTAALSWNASIDDHTPTEALTYQLELFRDNVPVNLPVHLPEPGNVSAITEWLLFDLLDGYYEWTLRAVDASYSGSDISSGSFDIGIPTGVNPIVDDPDQFGLKQNFPNPAMDLTQIEIYVPRLSQIQLKLYNVLGQEITTIVDQEFEKGVFEINVTTEHLSSGIYFYSLITKDHQITKKMQIIN